MHACLHIQTISRGSRKSTVAAAAYRSGSSVVACAAYRASDKLQDERYNKTHDYTRKQNVLHTEIIKPDHAPEWMGDRQKLWNGVEQVEKRKDAQLAKEIVLTLPRNLSHEQHKEVVNGWVADNVTSRGLIADYAIHSPDAKDGGKNPHAHVMFNLRPVQEDGTFGKKLTGYKNGGLDGRDVLRDFHFSYQQHLNKASAANDNEHGKIRFNLLSYRERGIDKQGVWTNGHNVNALEEKGIKTDRGNQIRKIRAFNSAKAGRQKYIDTFAKFGSGNKKHASQAEKARQDIANSYYDVMYGDGTEGSSKSQWYER